MLSSKFRHAALIVGLVGSAATASRQAAAQAASTDRVVARSLFDDARALMEQGKTPEACAKFAESQRLDPRGGTLLNLAVCHEKEGKTATAWVEFRDAVAMARKEDRSDREKVAKRHLKDLEPRLSRLEVRLAAGAQTDGLELRLDGGVIGTATIGAPIPVDPGEHKLAATAPGRTSWESTVVVGPDADRKVIEVPALAMPETARPEPLRATPAPAPVAPPLSSVPPERDRGKESAAPAKVRLGAFLRADVDGKLQGAVPVVGAALRVGQHVEFGAGALVGSNKGAWAGATGYLLSGPWKPTLMVGVPVFFRDGARPGVQGAAGVQWDFTKHASVFGLVGATHIFSAPDGVSATSFVPTAGIKGWL